jgi:hypothetical protein
MVADGKQALRCPTNHHQKSALSRRRLLHLLTEGEARHDWTDDDPIDAIGVEADIDPSSQIGRSRPGTSLQRNRLLLCAMVLFGR